ncbi:MAG TPA: SMC family ATPase [Chthonomonadaceae bacterium]|nr:SMC family ATPase [Chthonomonadaceae bacterium]
MIPITLTLKNFMSYGEEPTTLPLEGLHVACLSGDNGNGKSALLDAMTWALWGKTRASAVKSITEDDIIRQGADEVEVRFEFDLNAQRYRVVRKRRRGKSSGALWELTIADAEGDFLPVGGGSMRETGRQIAQLLSMEYETFLNSAYLQQGRADEFTRQTPDNRKRILGEILGLDRYDRLEAKARELYRERQQEAAELEREIRMLEAQIAERPAYQQQLEAACAALANIEEQVAQQERKTAELRDRRSKLDVLANRLADEEARLQRLKTDLANREEERQRQIAKLGHLQNILAQRASILSDYQKLQTAQKRREQLEPEMEAFSRINAELQTVIGNIDIEETRLKNELRFAEQECRAVEARSREHAHLEAQIAELAEALKAEAQVAKQVEAAQAALQQAQEAFAALRAGNDRLKEDIAEIDEVLELLARPHAQCPVCESDLSGKKHEAVVARQQEKRAALCRQQETLKKEGIAAKQAQSQAEAQVREWTRQRDTLAAQRSQYQQFVARRDALAAEGIDATGARKQAQELRTQLEREAFAGPHRVKRKRLESEIERLTLAKAEFETVRETIRRLEPTHKRYQELLQAEGGWEQEAAAKERLDSVIAALQQDCATEAEKLKTLRAKLAEYETVKAQTAVAEAELSRLQSEMTGHRVNARRFEEYIAQCEKAAESKKARAAVYKKTEEERRLYADLAAAFGKKGVQALIIENAIPELEDEANALLARMTDNAMQVSFETTRTAKSAGHEIETLDIKITDDAGTRPYELFSGGEAFRINFAVRIALSRLLARRSGAKLQTLILDEGFGTQDGKGRERLIEILDTIKDDFEKILVITHVEELKDAFPQRIEVTKDARGSRIHLL